MARTLKHLWRQIRPKGYTLCASVISLGGFLNGCVSFFMLLATKPKFLANTLKRYDTGSIGAVTTMPQFEESINKLSPTLQGFTVALIMVTGAVPGIFAGQLANRYGQLLVVMTGALVFTLGTALEAGSSKLSMFLVGRALAGIGEGMWLTNISVYITEIAPKVKRGTFVSMPQLMAAFGICAGYFTCYGSIHISSSLSWRLPFIIQSILAIVLAISCIYMPMSPRWLQLNNRSEEALRSIHRLDISPVEAEKDILRPRPVKEYRGRTMLAFFILGMLQLCGIDGVLYYAPILFTQAGLGAGTASFLASGVSAIAMLLVSIPAFLYTDKWGRRSSIITGGVLLSGSMFIIGGLYASESVHADSGGGRWLVIVLIFVFALSFVGTWGVVGKIYASEILDARTRDVANSAAQGLGFFTNWLVAFTTPIFLAHSSYGAYFLFGSLSLLAVLVLIVFMPETRGYSLEYIQEGFQNLHAQGHREALSCSADAERSGMVTLGKRVRRLLIGPVLFPDGVGDGMTISMELDLGQVQMPPPMTGEGGILRLEMSTV
ncbi:hypothetical protein BP5796_09677 [Coleophoma crateriformis]|uniref:Major facilitator superfamily (MFS) profile domain-containing protein n=1 Tax=Coleophoma crateriformis TaxID=565419 RepID=A0A3D8QZ17_9HELO|nr:hypothetical protein BP5796_09677 [Coleophoma crateriformis]